MSLFFDSHYSRSVSSVAAATLVGATLLASPLAAQTTSPKKPPAAAAATGTKAETLEQRIIMLHTALKITPDQEAKWTPVATAMRDNSAAMEKLVAAKKSMAPASMTAVDDLNTYQEFAQAHADGLKNLTAAFTALYDSMPATQKKNADQVFQKFGTPGTPAHG
jgi:periplasmic protein CpxP/Spy